MTAVLLGRLAPIDPGAATPSEDAASEVATYGSSETAGGLRVRRRRPGRRSRWRWVERGRIRIAGPVLFEPVRRRPGPDRGELVDGWFLTADAGRLDADGRLRVLGRLDRRRVSGGVNIPLPPWLRGCASTPDVTAVEVLGHRRRGCGAARRGLRRRPARPQLRPGLGGATHPRAWARRTSC
jgi:O-succinylbenzoic acid--CoA ligase